MAGQRVLLLVGFFYPGILLSEAAKILTVSTMGGSHYLLMDRVSQILQDHGHNVTMLNKRGNSLMSGIFENLLKVKEQLGFQCSHLLSRRDIMDSLENENFELVIIESFDYCPFLITEKLRKPFVSILTTSFAILDFGLPSPLSYVPVYSSLLTDHMDFWGRVRNFVTFFTFSRRQWQVQSMFDNTIKEHFPEGSRPVLSHLLLKAELWFVNSDFAFDFARPLLPNTVYVGGLMAKPTKPVPQDLENFIAKFGDSGFVLVTMGSMVNIDNFKEVLKELNSAFAHLPQGVIWRCKHSHWPKDVNVAPNVKLMEWLPQSDLLAHPRIRLFVTHGGQNSIMEAIQHGVPLVGIPVFGDQSENMVRVEAKKIGVSVELKELKAETLALKMKQIIEDKRYKSAAVAASLIRRSHPQSPAQRLVGWIDHILQTGGAAHLKPRAFQQPWHERHLLDVLGFLLGLTLGTLWLCGKLLGAACRWLPRARKLKET
ncbi:UDP-glucuronosyltransferase 3A2 [Otolemur garnettii]|nr:UDP-glucuronosyltransferase 3A2 [Otolemur garnettii]